MRVIPFLLLLLPNCLSAQYTPERKTEFGIDLIYVIVLSSGHDANRADLELIYRETVDNMDFRFKGIVTSYADEQEFLRRATTDDSTFLYNFYAPRQSYGIHLGLARLINVRKLDLYYGVDLALGFHLGDVLVTRDFCPPGNFFTSCEVEHAIDNLDYTVGVIPFLGGKVALTSRLLLTVEFGAGLHYRLGQRRYLGTGGAEEKATISGFELQLDRFLNDIAVTYRF